MNDCAEWRGWSSRVSSVEKHNARKAGTQCRETTLLARPLVLQYSISKWDVTSDDPVRANMNNEESSKEKQKVGFGLHGRTSSIMEPQESPDIVTEHLV